jgi:hypothetical protein
VVLMVCALMGTGVGYAQWASSESFNLGSIFHGTLDMGVPTETWQLKSGKGAILAADTHSDPALAVGELANLSTPCGDGATLEITNTYPLTRKGDNLTAEFVLTAPGAPGPVGQFAVTDHDDGTQLATGTAATTGGVATKVRADIPVATTALDVIFTYGPGACDAYNASAANYGEHLLEVVQT